MVLITDSSTSTDISKASPKKHKEGESPKEQAPSGNTILEQEGESPGHTFETPIEVATVDYVCNKVTTIVCAYINGTV